MQGFIEELRSEYPGVGLEAYESKDRVELMEIKVPVEMRGRGIGTEIVKKIQGYAAGVGKPLVLRPEAERGRKGDLERFYKRLGFVHNRGRNMDYTLSSPMASTMYWRPMDFREWLALHEGAK